MCISWTNKGLNTVNMRGAATKITYIILKSQQLPHRKQYPLYKNQPIKASMEVAKLLCPLHLSRSRESNPRAKLGALRVKAGVACSAK